MDACRLFSVVTLLALAFGVHRSEAASYCVGSSAEWQQALDAAEVDGEDSLVMVRSGNYAGSADLVYHPVMESIVPAGRLTVRGGYNAGCSAYSLVPGLTVVGGPTGKRFDLYTQTASVVLAGLTFDGTFLTMRGDNFTGEQPDECTIPGLDFELLRVRIDQAGAYIDSLCQHVLVENTLVTNGVSHPLLSNAPADVGLDINLVKDDDMSA